MALGNLPEEYAKDKLWQELDELINLDGAQVFIAFVHESRCGC